MIMAARLRETLGLPGMTVAETIPFRDKEEMKKVLDAHGIRTPRHANATTAEGIFEAARIGYPLIVKPIAGAGSMDTYRIAGHAELTEVIRSWSCAMSVEEFVEGQELSSTPSAPTARCSSTTSASTGRARWKAHNHASGSARRRSAVREPQGALFWAEGYKMGFEVLKALNFRTG